MRTVLRGFSTLAAGMLVTQLIGFAALAYAARELGPGNLGAATFALNVALYFATAANFGVGVLGIRDVAREPERGREIVGQVLAIRVVLGLVTAATMVALAPVLAADEDTRRLLPLAALVVVAGTVSGEWALFGLQRSAAVAVARLAGQVTYALLVVLLLGTGFGGAREFVVFTVVSISITSVMTLVATWRAIGSPRPQAAIGPLVVRVRASAPLGIALASMLVYQTISVVMLGYTKGTEAVGQFGAAQKIPLALYGVMDIWGATLFPQAARLADTDRDELRRQVGTFLSLTIIAAVPLAVGGALAGPELVPLLFGEAFRDAGGPFVILMAGLAVAMVAVNQGSVLAAGGDERSYARILIAGAVVTIVLGMFLIPLDGVRGAAFAILGAEMTILGLTAWRFAVHVGAVTLEGARIARGAAAATVMAAVMVMAGRSVGVVAEILLGAISFAAAAVALGVVRRSDLAELRRRP